MGEWRRKKQQDHPLMTHTHEKQFSLSKINIKTVLYLLLKKKTHAALPHYQCVSSGFFLFFGGRFRHFDIN